MPRDGLILTGLFAALLFRLTRNMHAALEARQWLKGVECVKRLPPKAAASARA